MRDVEGGRGGSVGVIFIVKDDGLRVGIRGLVGEAGLKQCPWRRQEDSQTGTNQRVVEQYKTWQTFVWSKRQERPKLRK